MGWYSDEYQVSLKSGENIFQSIDGNIYDVYRVHISQKGWFLVDGEKEIPIDRADFSVQVNGEKITFDVCFNIIHGTPGENGLMQAYWDMIGQKYTGCDAYTSALTFHKKDTLAVLKEYGIQSAARMTLRKGEDFPDFRNITDTLWNVVFVKPNASGSSLWVSRVTQVSEFLPAVEKAFQEGNEILIESALEWMEVSVGVIDYRGEIIVLGITEIVPNGAFFDYDAKYNGESQEITPARIDDTTRTKIEKIAIQVYKALGVQGLSRSEYIIVNGEPFLLEVNTNPGFTAASILPQQAKVYGISVQDVCHNEIEKVLTKEKK